jgi:MoxR-like ATPase
MSRAAAESIRRLVDAVGSVVVGQHAMVERLLIGLLTGGHVLLEGVPGLAKTLTVSALAGAIDGRFSRIQFTPDLLPADLVGTLIYSPQTGEFSTRKGPVFANIVLADEINRAPAKVQSALLEAMQEKPVTIGDETHTLPKPFLVLATQNPIEQEGTYPLPEAQVDRFMLKLSVGYPTRQEEREIVRRMASTRPVTVEPVVSLDDIMPPASWSTPSSSTRRSTTTPSRSSAPPASRAGSRAPTRPSWPASSSSAPAPARPSPSSSPPRPTPSSGA